MFTVDSLRFIELFIVDSLLFIDDLLASQSESAELLFEHSDLPLAAAG